MKCRNCKILEQENLRLSSTREILTAQEIKRYFTLKGYQRITLGIEYYHKDQFYFAEATNRKGNKIVRRERSFEELESSILGNARDTGKDSDLL